MNSRSSLEKPGNPQQAALGDLRSLLGAVVRKPRGDAHGIAVDHPAVAEAKRRALQKGGPFDHFPLPSPSQTDRELLEKGAEQCHFTSAILRGINHEDGREAGTPYLTDGDGNCLLNAVAMLLVKKQPRGVRNAVKTMAAQLRLGIVVEGLRNIEVYLDRKYEFYGTWYNYVDQLVFDLKRCGWVVDAMPENRWRMASLTSVQNVNGGEWQWTLFQPLVAPDPGRQTVHVVMTYVSSADYRPQFSDAHEYKRLNGGRIRELNHFVALSHDNTAKYHETAVTRMAGLVRLAQDDCKESEARLKEAVGDSGGSPSAPHTCTELADAQGKAQEQLGRRQAA
ncbi:unnamed protein product [Ectocarpus sp. CCAP 1310/34]|nr:unnamed protein product [Ectocarpus sp. CCAP 1310/34]